MDEEAQRLHNNGDFKQAEGRRILETQTEQESADAAVRTKYNLCATLVEQQKFDTAEPLLQDVITALVGRNTGKETRSFMLQEAGARRLLGQVLDGMGDRDEARQQYEEAARMEEQASSAP